MRTFDKDLTTKPLLTEESFFSLIKNTFLGNLFSVPNVQIIWTSNNNSFTDLINSRCSNGIIATDNPLTASSIFQKQEGRRIIEIDCSRLQKWGAVGTLYSLSQLQSDNRPIVVIRNITDIPTEGPNIDDPLYVESLLLHGWKESERQLLDKNGRPFTIRTEDYTILIPILEARITSINQTLLHSDGFGSVHFDEELDYWIETGFVENLEFYKKIGWLSSDNVLAVKAYLESIRNKSGKVS